MEIQAPDGTIVEFPDGTPTETIKTAMRKRYGGPAAPAPEAAPSMSGAFPGLKALDASGNVPTPTAAPEQAYAEPSLTDKIMGGLKTVDALGANVGRGLRAGAANIVGLPVDLINIAPMALNLIPGVSGIGPMTSNPVMGGKFLDNAAGGFGLVPEPPDAGAPGKIARRVGEELGAASIPVAGALGKAAQVGVQGARELPMLARMFVEPAAVNPSRFIRQEAAMATAAGTGAGAANTVVDPKTSPYGNLADMFGAFAGGGLAAGAQKAAQPLINTARALSPNAKFNYTDQFARNNVAETLGAAYGIPDQPGGMNVQPLIDAIERGNKPGALVPGFQESLADRVSSPGLAAVEYGRQTGPNSGQFIERRMANAEATNKAIQANAPTEATPGALRQSLEETRNTQLDRANEWARINQESADRARQGLTPQTDTIDRGTTLRNEIETARETARGERRQLYGNVDMNQQVDIRPFIERLNATEAGLGAVRQGLAPNELIGRVRALAEGVEGPVMAPLSTVDDLRSELLRRQRAALADPRAENGGRNAAEVIGRYADATDEFLIGNLPPEQQQALIAARNARRAEADAFGRTGDPVAAAVAQRDGGTPRMRDEQIPGMFAQRPDALEALLQRVDTPDTRAAIRDELLARFGRTGGTPEAANAFVQQYNRQLAHFPGLEQEIAQAAVRRDQANQATQVAETYGKNFGRPGDERGTGTVGKYLKFDDAKAGDAMKTVLNSPQPVKAMDELLTYVGNEPKAVEAARRQFWNVMEAETRSGGETTKTVAGVQPWLPNALKRFLDDPKYAGLAERLYRDNPEHLDNVRKIAEVLQGTDVRTRAKAANTSGTAQGVHPLLTPETFQSRLYNYQRGTISASFLVTSIAAVTGRRAVGNARTAAVNRLFDEALLNPEAAALLLKENNPANRTALRRVGKAWMGNEISSVVDLLDGPDETTDAVTRELTIRKKVPRQ